MMDKFHVLILKDVYLQYSLFFTSLLFFPIRRFLRENGFFVFRNKTRKEALLWAKKRQYSCC